MAGTSSSGFNIAALLGSPVGIGTGTSGEGLPGTGRSGPRGIESVLEFNGLYLNVRDWVDTYLVTTIGGLDDADVRDSRELNPGYHGETAFEGFYGGRTITLTGKIYSKTLFKLRDMQQGLRQAFAQLDRELPLVFRTPDPSLDMQIYCKKSQSLQMAEEQRTANHFERAFLLTLRASNPRFLSVVRVQNSYAFSNVYDFSQVPQLLTVEDFTDPSIATLYNEYGGGFRINGGKFEPTYKNLHPNPSAEYDLAGVQVVGSGTGAAIARAYDWNVPSSHGTWYYKLTQGDAVGSIDVRHFGARFPVTPGLYYSAAADFKPATNVRATLVYIDWYDAANTRITPTPSSPGTEAAGVWTRTRCEAKLAPAGAVMAQVIAQVAAVPAAEVHYVDNIVAYQATAAPDRLGYNNLITEGNFRLPIKTVTGTDCTLSQVSSGGALGDGGYCALTASAGLSCAVEWKIDQIEAGRQYAAMAYVRAEGVQRDSKMEVEWYNAAGASLGVQNSEIVLLLGGVVEEEVTAYGAWRKLTMERVYAPTGAVSSRWRVRFMNTLVNERHHVSKMMVVDRSTLPPNGYFDGDSPYARWLPGYNYVKNPTADATGSAGIANWTPSLNNNADFLVTTEQAKVGTKSFKLTRDLDAAGANTISMVNSNTSISEYEYSPQNGEWLTVRASFFAKTQPRSCRIRVVFGGGPADLIGTSVTDVVGSWTDVVDMFQIPPVATTFAVQVEVLAVPEGETHYVDTIMATSKHFRQDKPSMVPDYFDGDVTGYEWDWTSDPKSGPSASLPGYTQRSYQPPFSVLTTPRSLKTPIVSTKIVTGATPSWPRSGEVRMVIARIDDHNMLYASLDRGDFLNDAPYDEYAICSFWCIIDGVKHALTTWSYVELQPNSTYYFRAWIKGASVRLEWNTIDPSTAIDPNTDPQSEGTYQSLLDFDDIGITQGLIEAWQGPSQVQLVMLNETGDYSLDEWRYATISDLPGWDFPDPEDAGNVIAKTNRLYPLTGSIGADLRRDDLPPIENCTITLKVGFADAYTGAGGWRAFNLVVRGSMDSAYDGIIATFRRPPGAVNGTIHVDNPVSAGFLIGSTNILNADWPQASERWLRLVANGDVINAEFWKTDPVLGGSPTVTTTGTLTGPDKAAYGVGKSGLVGFGWIPKLFTDYVDDFRISQAAVNGTLFLAYNEGNFRAQPIIELVGPMTNAVLVNETNDERITLVTGTTIPSGEHWIIDIAERRMYRQSDEANRFQYLDVNSDWMELEPGENPIRLTATGMTATSELLINFRHTVM